MTVKEYYYRHFDELSLKKQFHFATRMNNFFNSHDFDVFLQNNQPDSNLKPFFANNDYSGVGNYELRALYFEKYTGLYGVETALFRVHYLLKEYNVDLRDDYCSIYPKKKLYKLADDLVGDPKALSVLSTWAVNLIYLTEELFPRQKNLTKDLSKLVLSYSPDDTDPSLLIYLYTHMIICESEFYTKDLADSNNLELLKQFLKRCADIISKDLYTIKLDAEVEFLVCCRMVGVEYADLKLKIARICNEDYKKNSPYLYYRGKTTEKNPNTFDRAEHLNALYIMSGLDI